MLHFFKRYIQLVWVIGGLLLLLPLSARAVSVISQGHPAQTNLQPSAAVALSHGNLSLANSDNQQNIYGVVVRPGDVSVNVDSAANQVEVVTNGQAAVAVSTINGDIASGDQLTASPIAGVVMKATSPGRILGVAQQNFSADSANITIQTLTAKDGSTKKVAIGTVVVTIGVGDYHSNDPTLPTILAPFQSLFSNVAGHPVSSVRTISSLVIFALSMILCMIILYSAVVGSIRSLGRNPLSRNAIFIGLIQVIAVVVVILLITFSIIVVIIRG